MAQSIWDTEHYDYLEQLAKDGEKTQFEMSVAMSKHFKMRVTQTHVQRMINNMRTPGHRFYRNLPYFAAGARRASWN
jgi:hypothetical protein